MLLFLSDSSRTRSRGPAAELLGYRQRQHRPVRRHIPRSESQYEGPQPARASDSSPERAAPHAHATAGYPVESRSPAGTAGPNR